MPAAKARWRLALGRSRCSVWGSSNTAASWLAAPSTHSTDEPGPTVDLPAHPRRRSRASSPRGRCAGRARRTGAARRRPIASSVGSSLPPLQLVGMAQQGERAVADQVDGRLVAGHVEQHDERQELLDAQPVARLLGHEERRQHVVAEVGPSGLDDLGEVGDQLGDRRVAGVERLERGGRFERGREGLAPVADLVGAVLSAGRAGRRSPGTAPGRPVRRRAPSRPARPPGRARHRPGPRCRCAARRSPTG